MFISRVTFYYMYSTYSKYKVTQLFIILFRPL